MTDNEQRSLALENSARRFRRDHGCDDSTRVVQMPDERYHAITTQLSCSQLKIAHDSLERFRHVVIDRNARVVSSRAVTLGSVADACLTRGNPLRAIAAVYPASCCKANGTLQSRTHQSRVDFSAECEAEGIEYQLRQDEYDAEKRIVEAVRSATMRVDDDVLPLWPLLEDADAQTVIQWTDSETDLRLRCKPDWMIPAVRTAFDLKVSTSVRPSAFKRRIVDQKYWLQDAHYCAGLEEAFPGAREWQFVFLVVNPEQPHQVATYSLDTPDRRTAQNIRRGLLRTIRECIDRDEWRDEWTLTKNTIYLNEWSF